MDSQSPYAPPTTTPPLPVTPGGFHVPLTTKQILFSFNGRIPRRTYWKWMILTMAGFLVPLVIMMPLVENEGALQTVCVAAMIPLFIVFCWMGLAIRVKRWHDHDKSGAWVLIGMIPYVGGLISFIFLGCMRGSFGYNRYGPDPT